MSIAASMYNCSSIITDVADDASRDMICYIRCKKPFDVAFESSDAWYTMEAWQMWQIGALGR
jgi:hypothetical protein